MNTELVQKIEAILFYTAEEIEEKELAKILEVRPEEITVALAELNEVLSSRGVRLVRHDTAVILTTAPEMSGAIEKMIRTERERDLGRAGLETLTIIAYKGPVIKKEIEYIRGVNSDYILRNLLLRSLVKKSTEEENGKALYTLTTEALLHLGLSHIEDLPEYEKIKKTLDAHTHSEKNTDTDDAVEIKKEMEQEMEEEMPYTEHGY